MYVTNKLKILGVRWYSEVSNNIPIDNFEDEKANEYCLKNKCAYNGRKIDKCVNWRWLVEKNKSMKRDIQDCVSTFIVINLSNYLVNIEVYDK